MAGGKGLRGFARERLTDYGAPGRIVFFEELPKEITGKVQRRTGS
jgi:acyl-coenzyme A synthetase/AMP-(fatty) acid ligase